MEAAASRRLQPRRYSAAAAVMGLLFPFCYQSVVFYVFRFACSFLFFTSSLPCACYLFRFILLPTLDHPRAPTAIRFDCFSCNCTEYVHVATSRPHMVHSHWTTRGLEANQQQARVSLPPPPTNATECEGLARLG
ncbi:hypothetical protein V8C35DRAFT_184702 [Trichoderma chlorosporum]